MPGRSDNRYLSKFSRWDERSSVRAKPRPRLEPLQAEHLYFPPELVAVAAHPTVVAAGPAAVEHVLLQTLYQYLQFTVELESEAVLPVTASISRRTAGLDLPPAMAMDAFAITTDEAWHAQVAHGVIRELETATGVPALDEERPQFLKRLAVVRETVEPALRPALDVLFAVVSETLISAKLSVIPNDRRIVPAVRAVVSDHAEDEGRHHAYFRVLLDKLWPALTIRERLVLGPLVPELIRVFLEPDLDRAVDTLVHIGLDGQTAKEVVRDSHSVEATWGLAHGARTTVKYFRAVGALDDGATALAFADAGLAV